MKLGAVLNVLNQAGNTSAIADQAKAYADLGFEGLWTAQAVGRGFMVHDPLMTLAVAAAVTDDMILGTAVLQVPLYHPLDLAHRIFCLKQVAGERFMLGVGAGSTAQDFHTFGRVFDHRFRDFHRTLADLREVLATGKLGDRDLSPWPEVLGAPKILLGSWGKGVKRAAETCDGWIASAMYRSADEIEEAFRRYQQAGGGTSVVSTIRVDAKTDLGELKDRLARFSEMGFDHGVVVNIGDAPPQKAFRGLASHT